MICFNCKGADTTNWPGGPCTVCHGTGQTERTRENGDALSLRDAQPGSAEYDYLHRYDSPDNQRDSMG